MGDGGIKSASTEELTAGGGAGSAGTCCVAWAQRMPRVSLGVGSQTPNIPSRLYGLQKAEVGLDLDWTEEGV